jgi:hypothetical protein
VYKLGDHAASVSDFSRAWSIDKEGTLSMLNKGKGVLLWNKGHF